MPVHQSSLRRLLGAVPAIGVSMAPKLICPACWPAYAGVLTSVGLGFLVSTVYLLPLTAVFLALALGALAARASRRHGHGPFLLGFIAAIGILLGKFVWGSNPTMYGAVGLLVIASLWNAWPTRAILKPTSCSDCHGTV